jgi:hypothetical protein
MLERQARHAKADPPSSPGFGHGRFGAETRLYYLRKKLADLLKAAGVERGLR